MNISGSNNEKKTKEAIVKNFSVEERELFSLLNETQKKKALERLASGELSPYVFGKKYFFKNYFAINSSCLIPRPDTERVVEKALSLLPSCSANIADLCCGCGCIALSVLDVRKDCFAHLVDISGGALKKAKENAAALGCRDRVAFSRSDILRTNPVMGKKFDIIVSNPPYLKSGELDLYPDLKAEPRIALDAGEDALVFYKRIISAFDICLKKGGVFVFEIGYSQKDDIERLAGSRGLCCEVTKDYGGNYRVAVIGESKSK